MALLRKPSLLFAAGCFGGFVRSVVLWQAGEQGVIKALGVKVAHGWSPVWLYPHLVWGGVWGLLFILPLFAASPVKKGLFLSLVPTLVQLFVLFPQYYHKGFMGIASGKWTPLVVLALNAVWGVAAGLWLRATGEK